MPIPVNRIIEKLDGYLSHNDTRTAEDLLLYWENEAVKEGDNRGLLSVLNEQIGFYRRNRDIEKGQRAINTALNLMKDEEPSFAVIYVNIATTVKSYGDDRLALEYFNRAKRLFEKYEMTENYEYAAFLNNLGTCLSDLGRFKEACDSFDKAVDILKKRGCGNCQIAVSYVNKAHVLDRSGEKDGIEGLLDLAWEELNNEPFPRGGEYAFAVSKCAPSFEYFGRVTEAKALMEVADEIYQGS